jgi:hypothetical protein
LGEVGDANGDVLSVDRDPLVSLGIAAVSHLTSPSA